MVLFLLIRSGGGESVSWLVFEGCIFVGSFDVRAVLGW